MSERTERSALATIEAFESAAFRIAQVARQLLAEHPGLPLWDIRPIASERRSGIKTAHLELSLSEVEDLLAWAEALGVTAAVRFYDAKNSAQAFEHHEATQTITGVAVVLTATRRPTEDEIALWRERKAAEAAGTTAPEGGAR